MVVTIALNGHLARSVTRRLKHVAEVWSAIQSVCSEPNNPAAAAAAAVATGSTVITNVEDLFHDMPLFADPIIASAMALPPAGIQKEYQTIENNIRKPARPRVKVDASGISMLHVYAPRPATTAFEKRSGSMSLALRGKAQVRVRLLRRLTRFESMIKTTDRNEEQ
jgi:hypothetical protein